MVEVSAKTFAKNCIHTIIQLKSKKKNSFMDKS